MNYHDENVSVRNLTYVQSVTYTLHRYYYPDYSGGTEYVKYGNYCYYWTTETTRASEKLGNQITKTTYTHSYLPYLENEGVDIKTTATTEVSFDYDGGWVEKDVTVTTILNGYFDSFASLKHLCPDLADQIDTRATRQYYVDVTVQDNISSYHNFYDTYYYIEKK